MTSCQAIAFLCFLVRIALIHEISCAPTDASTAGIIDTLSAVDAPSEYLGNYSAPPGEWPKTISTHRRRSARSIPDTDDLRNRSICRWTYHDTYDVSRRPQNLPNATCVSDSVDGIEMTCQRIFYMVSVMRRATRIGSGSIETWERRWERVAVGCTLAYPRVHRQNTPTMS